MAKEVKPSIEIKNKKAHHEFHILEHFTAGIVLQGTEIKSIRAGRASLKEAYCYFNHGELYIKSMHIAEYKFGSYQNHDPKRDRKLLLNKQELKKLHSQVKIRGHTIVPLRLFISEKGLAKVEIALGKGKNVHDKRQTLKEKELKQQMKDIY